MSQDRDRSPTMRESRRHLIFRISQRFRITETENDEIAGFRSKRRDRALKSPIQLELNADGRGEALPRLIEAIDRDAIKMLIRFGMKNMHITTMQQKLISPVWNRHRLNY